MNELREELAALIHEIRAGWTGSFFSQCIEEPLNTWNSNDYKLKVRTIIPEQIVDHWTRQMQSVYVVLPEEEKESDRTQADRILAIFERHKGEEAVTETRMKYEIKVETKAEGPWGLWDEKHGWYHDVPDKGLWLYETRKQAETKRKELLEIWSGYTGQVRSIQEKSLWGLWDGMQWHVDVEGLPLFFETRTQAECFKEFGAWDKAPWRIREKPVNTKEIEQREPEGPWGFWCDKRELWATDRTDHAMLTESLLQAQMKLHNIQRVAPKESWRIRSVREWQRTLYNTPLVEGEPCASPPL